MAIPAGASTCEALGLASELCSMLPFSRAAGSYGRKLTACRELDDDPGRIAAAGHEVVGGLCRESTTYSVTGEWVDPGAYASATRVDRREPERLTLWEYLVALVDLRGNWVRSVHSRRSQRIVISDEGSNDSATQVLVGEADPVPAEAPGLRRSRLNDFLEKSQA